MITGVALSALLLLMMMMLMLRQKGCPVANSVATSDGRRSRGDERSQSKGTHRPYVYIHLIYIKYKIFSILNIFDYIYIYIIYHILYLLYIYNMHGSSISLPASAVEFAKEFFF